MMIIIEEETNKRIENDYEAIDSSYLYDDGDVDDNYKVKEQLIGK